MSHTCTLQALATVALQVSPFRAVKNQVIFAYEVGLHSTNEQLALSTTAGSCQSAAVKNEEQQTHFHPPSSLFAAMLLKLRCHSPQ